MGEPETKENNTPEQENPFGDLNGPFGEGKKILLVEDDPTTVELLKNLLEKRAFEVETAQNGKIAMEKMGSSFLPNLIITDFVMPEVDGFQLFKGLRAQESTQNIPFIFLTVRKNMEDAFIVSGADAFFSKPLNTDEFLKQVKTLSLRSVTKSKKAEETAPEGGEKKEEEKKE